MRYIPFALILSALFFFHIRYSDQDLALYEKLSFENKEQCEKKAMDGKPIHQARKNVCKDLWSMEKGKRLHARIRSAESHLTLIEKKERLFIEEILKNVEGWVDDGSRFTAATAIAHFPKNSVHLEGNVQMSFLFEGKESFVLADSAKYHFPQKQILFDSAPSNRVLFWQEGRQISAPKVSIENSIQAIGDARFSFTPEELKAFENL